MQTRCKAHSASSCHFCSNFVALKTQRMTRIMLTIVISTFLLMGCEDSDKKEKPFLLQGAWTLRHVEYPIGAEYDYSPKSATFCRIYDGDSTLYECRLSETANGLVIVPNLMRDVMLTDQGGHFFYMEGDNPRPLTIESDSTIIIQQNGVRYTYLRADDIERQWGSSMRDIIKTDLESGTSDHVRHYVLSAKERQQAHVIHGFVWFSIAILIVVAIVAQIAISNRKEKRMLRLQLKQILEVKENRSQQVKQAVAEDESKFLASDDYHSLQRRIASGNRLKEQDWSNVEELMKHAWPGFSSQLRTLYPMSELEYQVCMLIKLRIPPTDIATVLARDISTISTVRSRLYKKVFGRKGGAREWDEFVLSIGT